MAVIEVNWQESCSQADLCSLWSWKTEVKNKADPDESVDHPIMEEYRNILRLQTQHDVQRILSVTNIDASIDNFDTVDVWFNGGESVNIKPAGGFSQFRHFTGGVHPIKRLGTEFNALTNEYISTSEFADLDWFTSASKGTPFTITAEKADSWRFDGITNSVETRPLDETTEDDEEFRNVFRVAITRYYLGISAINNIQAGDFTYQSITAKFNGGEDVEVFAGADYSGTLRLVSADMTPVSQRGSWEFQQRNVYETKSSPWLEFDWSD